MLGIDFVWRHSKEHHNVDPNGTAQVISRKLKIMILVFLKQILRGKTVLAWEKLLNDLVSQST